MNQLKFTDRPATEQDALTSVLAFKERLLTWAYHDKDKAEIDRLTDACGELRRRIAEQTKEV